MFDEFEHEVMCSLCTVGSSDPPNEIVLCDCCNTGYHQVIITDISYFLEIDFLVVSDREE